MKNDEKTRQAILRKLAEQRAAAGSSAEHEAKAARRFGSFLADLCQQKGWTASDLAHRLDIEPALAEAILDGVLPRSEIDDDFLLDIARVMDCPIETLRQL